MKKTKLKGLIAAAGFGAALATLTPIAHAAATLQIVSGSGDFQTLESAITVDKQSAVTLQWTTDQGTAAGGTWQVTNVTAGGTVVASGETTPAPAIGHMLRFTLPSTTFLKASTASNVKYNIRITPFSSAKQPLGSASPAVTVTQVPSSTTPPIVFGPSAVFPKVEIVTHAEKIGIVPQTQIHYAYADVTVKVSNKGTKATDPMWLNLKDTQVLMRQSSSPLAIPSLQPGASQTFTARLDAILPPGTSQLPQDQQYGQWQAQYNDRCGVDLRAVLDWRGPVADTPINPHSESFLVKEGWSDYAKVARTTPVCEDGQCVNVCQVEKNIRAQLDNKVMGYGFFVGNYPKFGAGGKARNSAQGNVAFTPETKITVASVSKIVTAIATVRLLDQKNISLDAAIGPYLPTDWNVSDYVYNLTFAQLLSQRSGIKHYGNVKQDYAQLKSFFSQSVDPDATTMCQPASVTSLANPINPNDTTNCYSNYNTAIMRVLLPKLAGFAEDANLATRPTTLANQYISLVQQHVFNRVNQPGVTCKPPANSSTYAFAYKTAGDVSTGTDFGDVALVCGAAGWYLSVEDIAKVFLSLSAKDGKILAATVTKDLFETMRQRRLGWDVVKDTELEKNGAWGSDCDANAANCDLVTTSVAVFGPVTGPRIVGVLFVNSAITGGANAQGVLEKAYFDAVYPKP